MNCPKCGASASSDDLFCGVCGMTLPKSDQVGKRTCPKCQTPFLQGDTFCGVCGTALPKQQETPNNICLKCSTPFLPGDTFCGVCGAALPNLPKPPQRICLKCNAPYAPNDTFCGVCGAKIENVTPTVTAPPRIISPPIQAPKPQQGLPSQTPRPQVQPSPQTPISYPASQYPKKPAPATSFSYGEDSTSKASGGKGIFIIIGVVILLIVASVGGLLWFKWHQENVFRTRIETALSNNQIFAPPVECVADIIASEKAKDPNSKRIVEYAPKIRAVVEPPIEKAIQTWYKDSDLLISWEELEKQFGFLNSLYPDDKEVTARLFYCSGQKAIKNNNFDTARDFYLKALDTKPGWALPLNGLGKVFIREDSPYRDPQKALAYYRQATEFDPYFTWAFVNLAIYYKNSGDLETAKSYMQKAVETNPTQASPYSLMGAICYRMSNFTDAELYFKKALEYETDSVKRANLEQAIRNLAGTTNLNGENTQPSQPAEISTYDKLEQQILNNQPIDLTLLNLVSKEELRLLRNTIFARHGMTFGVAFLQQFFSQKSWYQINPDYDVQLLTEQDKLNADAIKSYE